MCGIISILSLDHDVLHYLLGGLERLEYRGYDSAGIAYIDSNVHLDQRLVKIRATGELENLRRRLDINIRASSGIGHTRWATHGNVTETNTHPHTADGIAIVHNGIIENYRVLRDELQAEGHVFESETDSEIAAHLIAANYSINGDFQQSFVDAIHRLDGTYAIVAISKHEPNIILGAKLGSPLTVGIASDTRNLYIASDAIALSSLCTEISYLEEGDIVIGRRHEGALQYEILNKSRQPVQRAVTPNTVQLDDVSKNNFEDFTLKEIHEGPRVVRNVVSKFDANSDIVLRIMQGKGISIIACGTSFYAGLLAKYWIEELAGIHVDVEIASEFRYRAPVLPLDNLYVFISQSGETSDTLAALRLVNAVGLDTLAIVNVAKSSIARESTYVLKTEAGTEVGVASTKAFVAQSMNLLLLSLQACHNDNMCANANAAAKAMEAVLTNRTEIQRVAELLKDYKSLFFLGRGPSYPLALEAALKIKELAYVYAEGCPAGEIKHGPIALVDADICTIVLAPLDRYFGKTMSNTQEILARDGRVLFFTNTPEVTHLAAISDNSKVEIVLLPEVGGDFALFPFITATHLLAYYAAKARGHNIDKPRNLAKSVTVE